MVVIDETAWRGTPAAAYAGWASRQDAAAAALAVALAAAEREILAGGGGLAERLAAIDLPAAVGAPSMPVRRTASRDRENRRRLAADLAFLRERGRRRDHAEDARLAALGALEARIVALEAGGETVQLVAYESGAFAGDGIAVVAIGDLDAAQNVGVVVPGMGTTLGSVTAVLGNAENLLAEARRADPSRTVATVAWIGYDAPSGWGSAKVLGRSAATHGAAALQRDLREIDALVEDRRVVVFGHSYGSTTVATAGADGALAGTVDAMVLLGSPGAGPVRSAAELGIPVYVARDPADPIPQVARTDGAARLARLFGIYVGLGTDPAAPSFGATALPAGERALPTAGAHSGYFAEGSPSLRAFAEVLMGGGGDAR
ncbi:MULTISPECIES: alpha/beta hydrolase [Tsukamurella]|uniref:DUF1023 domain-containing protein n=2 Tax=Tsukamurella TaxID=2060 RepID=A0A5C5RY50_9ACTN|nr:MULTISPECIES: alpha/beta hydrolase [Tsukamurella]NMD56745.1 hypothetical protein [Tsukamurella columbiensis]TWS27360.1 hypothetical protein FK530_18725 [Tsukamurella conjunctivitidis]